MSDSAELPLFASPISAGFPSPADDYVEKKLDLNEHLVGNRQATFFLRVSGDSMIGAGIHNGDLLIVDKSIPAVHKKIVVAVVDGELVVKRLLYANQKVFLAAENPNYAQIEVTEEQEFAVWGVVTKVIHEV
ncbi:MAG: translesion error-prone DNA polymerase V autoproteolytic subunit [Candidatus Obscuribacterales bacterium]|nr:translesion error-prone DNA polymerase V autoproteolytic subunit [Candidatus Obscuribacterales bacterium]